MQSVPVIDMADAHGGRNLKFVEALGKACEGIGFAVLVNHGVDTAVCDRAYDAMRTLFRLPLDVLTKYELPACGRQTGFTSPYVEGAKDNELGDLKQFWHVRRELPPDHPGRQEPSFVENVWPVELPDFKATSLAMFNELDRLSVQVLIALNTYLGLEEGTLPGMTEGGESVLRLLHYMSVDPELAKKGCLRSSPHEDIDLGTLLVAARSYNKDGTPSEHTKSGLRVKTRAGTWTDVDERPGSIVFNVGDMLQEFTGGRLISTTHGVWNPPNGDLSERDSMPFFMHPRGKVILNKLTGLRAAAYLRRRLIEIGVLTDDAAQ